MSGVFRPASTLYIPAWYNQQLLMSSTAFLVFVSLVFAATVARGALNLNLIFKVGRSSGEQRLSREKKVGVRLVWARFERSAEGNLFEYGGVRAGCPALFVRREENLEGSNRAIDTLHLL